MTERRSKKKPGTSSSSSSSSSSSLASALHDDLQLDSDRGSHQEVVNETSDSSGDGGPQDKDVWQCTRCQLWVRNSPTVCVGCELPRDGYVDYLGPSVSASSSATFSPVDDSGLLSTYLPSTLPSSIETISVGAIDPVKLTTWALGFKPRHKANEDDYEEDSASGKFAFLKKARKANGSAVGAGISFHTGHKWYPGGFGGSGSSGSSGGGGGDPGSGSTQVAKFMLPPSNHWGDVPRRDRIIAEKLTTGELQQHHVVLTGMADRDQYRNRLRTPPQHMKCPIGMEADHLYKQGELLFEVIPDVPSERITFKAGNNIVNTMYKRQANIHTGEIYITSSLNGVPRDCILRFAGWANASQNPEPYASPSVTMAVMGNVTTWNTGPEPIYTGDRVGFIETPLLTTVPGPSGEDMVVPRLALPSSTGETTKVLPALVPFSNQKSGTRVIKMMTRIRNALGLDTSSSISFPEAVNRCRKALETELGTEEKHYPAHIQGHWLYLSEILYRFKSVLVCYVLESYGGVPDKVDNLLKLVRAEIASAIEKERRQVHIRHYCMSVLNVAAEDARLHDLEGEPAHAFPDTIAAKLAYYDNLYHFVRNREACLISYINDYDASHVIGTATKYAAAGKSLDLNLCGGA